MPALIGASYFSFLFYSFIIFLVHPKLLTAPGPSVTKCRVGARVLYLFTVCKGFCILFLIFKLLTFCNFDFANPRLSAGYGYLSPNSFWPRILADSSTALEVKWRTGENCE